MANLAHHMKPTRWFVHLPLAILPFLAAAVIQGSRLGPDLEGRVRVALEAAGQGWASPHADGRDIEIRGSAPNREAFEAVRAAVAGVAGVRSVAMHVAAPSQ